jgi:NAD(P)-dependent dehydrogenase (short-subunit alcohol dehydrogenase family)
MNDAFENKVALITGATSGIGKATALAFARQGARVVLSGRREAEGGAVVAEIQAAKGQARFVKTDVTDERQVAALVEATLATYGRLDFAFNNAGREQPPTALTDTTDADYQRLMDTNVRGVFYALKHELPALRRNGSGGGAIVNTSSVAGLIGMAGVALYIAAKHAVNGLTKAVALEVAKENIRVNALCPAAVETEMFHRFAQEEAMRQTIAGLHPVGRLGRPEEVAAAVLYLCSPGAAFLTGVMLPIDGGWTAQ